MKSEHEWSLRRASQLFALAFIVPSLVACGGAKPGVSSTATATAAGASVVEAELAREYPVRPLRKVNLLGGLVTGSIESEDELTVECFRGEIGETCGIAPQIGMDSRGNERNISCVASDQVLAPAALYRVAIDGQAYSEVPRVAVTPYPTGIAMRISGNTRSEEGVGSLKFTVFYGQGYTVVCTDIARGARDTFVRVVDKFLASLELAPNPEPVLFAVGHRISAGGEPKGIRYTFVKGERSGDKAGFSEQQLSYRLEVDGQKVYDDSFEHAWLRDADGNVDKLELRRTLNGTLVRSVSAKRTEDGSYRIKSTVGTNTESLQLKPKAPPTSEAWSAPEMLLVSKGKRASFRYAFLATDKEGDLIFSYSTLARSNGGGLVESFPTESGAPANELRLDERGHALKLVSPQESEEQLYRFGTLPRGAAAKSSISKEAPSNGVTETAPGKQR